MTTPIPQRASGVLYGSSSAEVYLDVFVDIQCPHSQKLWPTLMQVMEHYTDKPVNLKTHIITISNHRQALDMSLELFAVADGDNAKFYQFATFLYGRQEQCYNPKKSSCPAEAILT
jgi:protein-disulfide isomerase